MEKFTTKYERLRAKAPSNCLVFFGKIPPELTNMMKVPFLLLLLTYCFPAESAGQTPKFDVDYKEFLGQHDMIWDRVPHRWEVSPYSGNGNIGFLFYQGSRDRKNQISIHVGRHDYYDHRLPEEGKEHLWIYRSRLPLGRFILESEGEITGANMRLDLWNAELTGRIQTTEGSFAIHAFSHSLLDVIWFETQASGEAVKISWHPEEPAPPVRVTLDHGGGPKGGIWDAMRKAPLPMPPPPLHRSEGNMNFCLQELYQHRGETTTGWEILGDSSGKQTLLASVHHSFPEKNSLATVKQNLQRAEKLQKEGNLISTHRAWWHDYYPQSFLTINDPEKEAFYWIQMYKLASAVRGKGPILDLMGPWYYNTFWPMVWGDLNVQLIYWTHLTANRMEIGESLINNIDKYAENLTQNVPKHWKDSASMATLIPQDLKGSAAGKVPDMLAWLLHNYWLHCEYGGDRQRMRDGLFPILRRTGNAYLNYLKDNPVTSGDGTIHIRNSWSPEYPGGNGQDINFTIGLMDWVFQTLLEINEEHGLKDPLAAEWRRVSDHLVDYQVDKNGLRIGRNIPFDKPHRHYSHLLPFYPLHVINLEEPDNQKLLRTSLDHWLYVSMNLDKKDHAMPVTGYTATGAASIYATLGDSKMAYHYLDFLIKHRNVSTTTMYAEGNPVIESPLSFSTSIHDMLLQSWSGVIRVFPAAPDRWQDVAFHRFRTEGAFLVSARKEAGETQFVSVESEKGGPCIVKIDIANPVILVNGEASKVSTRVKKEAKDRYRVQLAAGESVLFFQQGVDPRSLTINQVPVKESDQNLFGYSKKTERLPGHNFYKGREEWDYSKKLKRGK
ncbi:glycosyl hydrolase family 95 catalytic domain-containing protein [Haloferula sp.]|uniref:glycosyl hydrolase family 95 catalytic domain-containing protein n=1 Tax=Haloferula sp. TaxID=2497595 RepID=UPI003C795799